MTVGNHLTVRDYFDQVLVGKTLNRKAYSPQGANNSANRTFHQMLASRGGHQINPVHTKPSGLTVVDYLQNPVRVNCHYNYRILSDFSTQENAAGKVSLSPALKSNINAGDGPTERSGAKRKLTQLKNSTASTLSPNQTRSNEKLIIERSIHKAAQKYNLPTGLIRGVIRAESNFQVDAISRAGAQGLMQLMPATAKELGVDNPFDIEQNINGGARYLRKMLDNFGGNLKVALAAYNAGPGAVEKYAGQIPPYQETVHYIDRVLRYSRQMA